MKTQQKSIPRSERITSSRTNEEKIAITLEYLCTFAIWSEALEIEALETLKEKIMNLIHESNPIELNNLLRAVNEYLELKITNK